MKKVCLFLFFSILIYSPAKACECIFGPHTLKEWAKNYPYIFYAEVESLVDNQIEGFEDTIYALHNSQYFLKGGYHPKLKVKEVFKGKVSNFIQEGYLVMNNGWTFCGDFFRPGEKILIFAHEGQYGTLSTSTCDLNRVFASEEEFLSQREEIKKATRKKLLGIF